MIRHKIICGEIFGYKSDELFQFRYKKGDISLLTNP